MVEPTSRSQADHAARPPGRPDAQASARGHRFEDLLAAEQSLVTVRWVAALFSVYLVVTYGGPAPVWAPMVGFGIAAGLVLSNAAAALALRRIRTSDTLERLALTTLATDTLVVSGFVWLYTFDEGSVHFLLFFVLPAEAALKFQLVGALGTWTAIAGIYSARQAWAAATYGFQLSVPSIVFRMGILLIVTAILGLFALRLSRRSEELSQTVDQLRREERWRSALIDMLAHDFRAPVGTALGTMEMVDHQLEDLPPARIRPLVAAAMRQSRRGLALADDILTLARARHDHLDVQRRDTDVTAVLRRVVQDMGHGEVGVDAPGGLRADIDPARFEQVVTNLVSNAHKHGRPPVVLTARSLDGAGVELRVSDAGDGVAPEYQDGLFTQFSSGPRRDSVGLGLWLVDVIATAHGGRATYATVEGRPTFEVTLPGPSPDLARDDAG